MTTEIKRDLVEDLAICGETEPAAFIVGSTTSEGTSLLSKKDRRLCAKTATVEIAEFIAEAREGWPHAIRRAIGAEAENDLLFRILREIDGHIRATDDPIPYIVATLKRALPEYYEDGGDFFAA